MNAAKIRWLLAVPCQRNDGAGEMGWAGEGRGTDYGHMTSLELGVGPLHPDTGIITFNSMEFFSNRRIKESTNLWANLLTLRRPRMCWRVCLFLGQNRHRGAFFILFYFILFSLSLSRSLSLSPSRTDTLSTPFLSPSHSSSKKCVPTWPKTRRVNEEFGSTGSAYFRGEFT